MNTKTADKVELVLTRLRTIASQLTENRLELDELRRARLAEGLNGKAPKELLRLDQSITRVERDIADLETMRAGLAPTIAAIRAAEEEVVRLERTIASMQDELSFYQQLSSIRADLILPLAEKIIELRSHPAAGFKFTSESQLNKLYRALCGGTPPVTSDGFVGGAISDQITNVLKTYPKSIEGHRRALEAARDRLAKVVAEAHS